MTRRLLHAYIDETGDRGVNANSSRFFAFAGVVVPSENVADLNSAVRACRGKLGVPSNMAMHWQEHAKVFPRRQFVASQLAEVYGVQSNFVLVEKTAIPNASVMRTDRAMFYNYSARLLMERLLLAARDWEGGTRKLAVTFGHVRGHDHEATRRYFTTVASQDSRCPWDLLAEPVRVESSAPRRLGLQAADSYAGALSAALYPNRYGGYEEHHLLALRHQIRRNSAGRSAGYGFKALVANDTLENLPWWPSRGI